MKLIPVYTAERAHLFCEYGTPTDVQRGFEVFKTHLLKPDVEFSLLELSQSEELINAGLVDTTDSIDPCARLLGVMIRIVKDDKETFYYHECSDPTALAHYEARPVAVYRTLGLTYSEAVNIYNEDGEGVRSFVHVTGNINIETGTMKLEALSIAYKDMEFADIIETVGFELEAQRVNLNRRAI